MRLLLALVCTAGAVAQLPAGWPALGGDQQRRSHSLEAASTLPKSGPKVDWLYQEPTGLSFSTSPVAGSDGTVYGVAVGASTAFLIAVDGTTGNQRWRSAFPAAGVSSPTLGASAIYVASGAGVLYAFAYVDGSVLWSMATSPAVAATCSSPLVVGSTVLVAGDAAGAGGAMFAFDAMTGRSLWTNSSAGVQKGASPVLVNGTRADGSAVTAAVFVGANAGSLTVLRAVDVATGWALPSFVPDFTMPPSLGGAVSVTNDGKTIMFATGSGAASGANLLGVDAMTGAVSASNTVALSWPPLCGPGAALDSSLPLVRATVLSLPPETNTICSVATPTLHPP